MIVICSKCQAKFRVADEKIGPRGARVRCSRCQAVFRVQARASAPEPAAPPAPPPPPASAAMDVELENPFAPAPALSPDDPFAAAGLGSLVASAAPEVSPSDPFAAPPPESDPFAPPAADDPFAAPARPAPAARGEALAVTDLADLLGAAAAPAPPPLPEPAPEAEPAPEPDGLAASPAPEAPAPDLGGLALEDRVTPPPLRAGLRAAREPASGLAPLPASEGLALGEAQAFGVYELGPAPPLALGDEPTPPLAPGDEPAPTAFAAASATEAPLELAARQPEPPAAPADAAPAGPAPEPVPPRRGSRVRSVILNAMALAAMLLVALALLVLWRSERPLEAFSLRPSAVIAALRGGAAGPFAAVEVRSGVYERERGAPLLFVRGKVLSRAPAPVRAVKVVVEVVRADAVVARGEALAGAVPTPEELWAAPEAATAASLGRAAAARAPREIRPGDAVPFLVALSDAPADLEGASVRVELAAAGAAP